MNCWLLSSFAWQAEEGHCFPPASCIPLALSTPFTFIAPSLAFSHSHLPFSSSRSPAVYNLARDCTYLEREKTTKNHNTCNQLNLRIIIISSRQCQSNFHLISFNNSSSPPATIASLLSRRLPLLFFPFCHLPFLSTRLIRFHTHHNINGFRVTGMSNVPPIIIIIIPICTPFSSP